MKVYCCVFGVNPLMVHSIPRKKKQKTKQAALRELKCENTTESIFDQQSLFAQIQLPFVCTNKRSTSPLSFTSPQTCLNAFTPRWWHSICYDGLSHLSRCSARRRLTEQLWSEISEVHTDRVKGGCIQSFLGSACSRTSHTLLLQNEMDDMFGFKCIFNRTVSSHLS